MKLNPFTKMIERRVAAEVGAMRAEFEDRLGSMVEHVLTTIDFPELAEFADTLELLRDDYEAVDFAALEAAAETVNEFEGLLDDLDTRVENVETEGATDRETLEELGDRVSDIEARLETDLIDFAQRVETFEARLDSLDDLAGDLRDENEERVRDVDSVRRVVRALEDRVTFHRDDAAQCETDLAARIDALAEQLGAPFNVGGQS